MKSPRAVPSLLLAAIGLSLAACDDASSPVQTVEPHLAEVAGPPFLPELPGHCPAETYERTPEQVLDDHRAALAGGDLDSIDCNYAIDAVVLSDGGIDVGHDAIRSSVAFFLQVFGGTLPHVVQQITVEVEDTRSSFPPAPVLQDEAQTYMTRLLYTIDTPCVTVPDGIDTYIIRSGQIHAQTSHGFPVFHCF